MSGIVDRLRAMLAPAPRPLGGSAAANLSAPPNPSGANPSGANPSGAIAAAEPPTGAAMAERFVSRGFVGRRQVGDIDRRGRIPPGQHEINDFPVLSAGPTPHTPMDQWDFTLEGLVEQPAKFTWAEIQALPAQEFVVDISCVTKWTHLDMRWRGVSLDVLLEHVKLDPKAAYAIAYSDGGYTTNLPIPDMVNGQAFIAWEYDGKALAPPHGGPARMVVPHLYFWKSAKWVRGIRFVEKDQPGFWESLGYNNHGDPWKEERYSGD